MLNRFREIRPSHNDERVVFIVWVHSAEEKVFDLALHRPVERRFLACAETQAQRLRDVVVIFWWKDMQAGVHGLKAITLDQYLPTIYFGSLRGGEAVACHLAYHVHRNPVADQGQRRR